jgi:hypothetical protein
MHTLLSGQFEGTELEGDIIGIPPNQRNIIICSVEDATASRLDFIAGCLDGLYLKHKGLESLHDFGRGTLGHPLRLIAHSATILTGILQNSLVL